MGFCWEFFCFSAVIGKCCHSRNLSVVSEQPCVHQNRFIVEIFRFLVPMFSKVLEMRFLVLKSLDPLLFFMYMVMR